MFCNFTSMLSHLHSMANRVQARERDGCAGVLELGFFVFCWLNNLMTARNPLPNRKCTNLSAGHLLPVHVHCLNKSRNIVRNNIWKSAVWGEFWKTFLIHFKLYSINKTCSTVAKPDESMTKPKESEWMSELKTKHSGLDLKHKNKIKNMWSFRFLYILNY